MSDSGPVMTLDDDVAKVRRMSPRPASKLEGKMREKVRGNE